MDAIRVSKVGGVACTKSGLTLSGTIHLTAHHLIFRYDGEAAQEMWVPYPLISSVSCLPQTLQGKYPVTFHTRTFETFSLGFVKPDESTDVFETVKELTVVTSVTQLYAFFYRPNPPLPSNTGWFTYSPREEFGRMGVGTRSKAWRFTDVNKDYSFCPTYPARLVVPTKISDTTLQYASKYRSKCRIPVLTYLHWANYGSITRSSQPMVGITQNRSIQDEKLIEAVFQSQISPESRASSTPVYGATTTNLIIDARPTTNAVANTAKGAGTENMDHYKEGKKAYLGIDNIHTMRDSLLKVVEALRQADAVLASISSDLAGQFSNLAVLDRGALRRSGWLRHISAIIGGTLLIVKNIHVNSSHVLIHCSDGWDRTSQLSALSQLCLDPFYRTIRGFEILIEKDWLSYGHKFLDRCGHLSSDKFFLSTYDAASAGSGADAAQAFLSSVQNRFGSQPHLKETSPVFHQFLESVRQVQRQFPERFEFNERFLRRLHYHVYSCQFGTFLYNSERERRFGVGGPPACDRTVSIWDFLNSPGEMEQNCNPKYDPSLDEPTSRAPCADMGVLLPNPKDIRFWHELYSKTDEEMNGRTVTARTRGVEVVLGPIDNAEEEPEIQGSDTSQSHPSPSDLPGAHSARPETLNAAFTGLGHHSDDPSASTPEVYLRLGSANLSNNEASDASQISNRLRPARIPSPSSRSPNFTRTRPPDFLSSTAVKSVWGKFSSNASAAFSVVQDAYAGVTKDLKIVAQGNNEDDASKDREALQGWGEELPPSTSPVSRGLESMTLSSTGGNPWATSTSKTSHVDSEHNPWGSPGSTQDGSFDITNPSLPKDPTVAHPVPRAVPTKTETSSTTRTPPIRKDDYNTTPMTNVGYTSWNTDPLGVGLDS